MAVIHNKRIEHTLHTMRKNKQYKILIASNLIDKMKMIEQHPPPIPGFTISRMEYLIHLILSHKQKHHPGSYSLLNSEYLRNVVPHSGKYLNYLKDEGIIEWINHFAGRNSRLYRLKEEGKTEYRTLTDKKLIYRIEKNRIAILRRNSKKYPVLNSFIHRVKINKEAALNAVENEYRKRSLIDPEKAERRRTFSLAEIEKIHQGQIFIKCNSTNGRLDSNFTRLPGEMIPHLTIDGKHLKEVDISCSQPFFAASLFNPTPEIKKIIAGYLGQSYIMLSKSLQLTHYKDVKLYTSLVTSGKFYQYMMNKFKENDISFIDRKDLKEQLFIVFFGRNGAERYSKAARLFSKCFPNVWQLFKTIKKEDYRKLAILLQKIESFVILQRVAPRIVQDLPGVPFITKHDSILPSDILIVREAGKVKKIMAEVIKEVTGYCPKIRIKNHEN